MELIEMFEEVKINGYYRYDFDTEVSSVARKSYSVSKTKDEYCMQLLLEDDIIEYIEKYINENNIDIQGD